MKSRLNEAFEKFGSEMPEIMSAFRNLHDVATKDGLLDAKTKRLIMVAVGVAQHCEPCIQNHVRAALDMNITRQEILEAAGIGILMGGGPSMAASALYLMDELDRSE